MLNLRVSATADSHMVGAGLQHLGHTLIYGVTVPVVVSSLNQDHTSLAILAVYNSDLKTGINPLYFMSNLLQDTSSNNKGLYNGAEVLPHKGGGET